MAKTNPSKARFTSESEIPEKIKSEEEQVIFCLSLFIAPEQVGVALDAETRERLLDPIQGTLVIHSSPRDNFLAFKFLARLLDPTVGPLRIYPQNSWEWIALRRLFVQLLGKKIPSELMLKDPEKVSVNPDEEVADDSLVLEWEHLRESYCYENPPVFKLSEKIGIENLREVSRLRCEFYEAITFAGLKREIIESGSARVDSNCGSLYEVVRRIPLGTYPMGNPIPDPSGAPSVMGWLFEIAEEIAKRESMENDLRRAVQSAREVLFGIAVESVYGKYPPPRPKLKHLEEMWHGRRIFENPYLLMTDERTLASFADRVARNGSKFLRHMADVFENAENTGTKSGVSLELLNNRMKLNSVKLALAVYWVHPDFPVWLMSDSAIQTFLRSLGFPPEETRDTKIADYIQASSKSPGGFLYRRKKGPIKEFSITEQESRVELTFSDYVKRSRLHSDLQKHIASLRPPSPKTEE